MQYLLLNMKIYISVPFANTRGNDWRKILYVKCCLANSSSLYHTPSQVNCTWNIIVLIVLYDDCLYPVQYVFVQTFAHLHKPQGQYSTTTETRHDSIIALKPFITSPPSNVPQMLSFALLRHTTSTKSGGIFACWREESDTINGTPA